MLEIVPSVRMRSYKATDFAFCVARTSLELEGFWDLRHKIFCEEQQIFKGTDKDGYDGSMIPIVCVALIVGMPDKVVGCVRIDERDPGVWWGSRLGVDCDYRSLSHVSPGVQVRNGQPEFFNFRSVGAGLIYKAVSTAHRLGCKRFLATVQRRNAPFFRRLHWRRLREIECYGMSHVEMEADLAFYPPAAR